MALPRRVHQPDRPLVEAEKTHRGHAAIKQVFAELKAGPLAHMPSKSFNANGAWLAIATVAFNLTRALGVIADGGCDVGLVGYEMAVLADRAGALLDPMLIGELRESLRR